MPGFSVHEWPESVRDRRAYVDPIFAKIAIRYDFMTRALSLGQEQRQKRRAVRLIPKDREQKRLLDLATGTGDFPLHVCDAGFKGWIVGLDRNPKMLAVARRKCAQQEQTQFVLGDLTEIPFKNNSFDVITIGYGLRYVADIQQTLREVFRLLRSNGMFICLDFGIPKNPVYRQVCFGYLLLLGSVWGLILHRRIDTYWHIVESLKAYPGQEAVEKLIAETGFRDVQLFQQLGGIMTIFSGTRP